MLDQYNRRINYLRISVTDRCNLRCKYCMPEEGIKFIPHQEILSFEEIARLVEYGAGKGINKIRITGGEPLMRKGITDLIKMISDIPGIRDIGMTTNGILLDSYADQLKKSGLNRVNISLDTLNPDKYKDITRRGNLNSALKGIDAALSAGLEPVKINFVKIPGLNETDEFEIRSFCKMKGLQLRIIRQMNLNTGEFYPVDGGEGGICTLCNRLRLTSDGHLVPCLHSNLRYNIRSLGIEESFRLALENKPLCGVGSDANTFYAIGG